MADKTEGLDPLLISGGTDPTLIDDKMKLLCRQVIEMILVGHYLGVDGGAGVGYNEAAAGEHLGLIMHQQASPGEVDPDKAALFVKTVGDAAELFFMDEGEKEIRITKLLADLTSPIQSLNLDIGALSFNTALKSLNTDGDALNDVIKTGRNLADDADVTFIPDGAKLDTSADLPDDNAALVHKKYVAEQIAASSAPVYAGEQSYTYPGGLIFKQGTQNVGGDTTDTVTFSTPFLNSIKSCSASWNGNSTSEERGVSVTSTITAVKVTNPGGDTKNIWWQVWGW